MSVINFERIESQAMTGMRRTSVFLGLGINAANRKDFRDYSLSQESILQMLPEVPDDIIDDWKNHFRSWIIAGGFRELMEHLCLFLDKVFVIVKRMPDGPQTCSLRDFAKLGLDKKIRVLATNYGITSGFDEAFASLYAVRNCLVHRLGIVGIEDVAQGELILRFHAPKIFIDTPSGEIDIHQEPKYAKPIKCPEGGELKMSPFMLHERRFQAGKVIDLSPHELHQILFFSQQCVKRILTSANDYIFVKLNQVNRGECVSECPAPRQRCE